MKKLFSHFVKIVMVWAIGFIVFTATLPTAPDDSSGFADAIVVLTGDSNRITTGFNLYKNNKAAKLFISGVYHGTNVMDLARPYLSRDKIIGIEIDDKATNTRENAIETAKWLKKNKYQSIILVTSNYHMRRARMHFQSQMPDLAIIPYPVTSTDKNGEEHWFKTYKGIKTMVRAYNKLIVTYPLIFIKKTLSA